MLPFIYTFVENNLKTNNMAANIPTVKQIAWVSLIPQIIIMGLLVFAYQMMGYKEAFYFGAITYLILTFVLRNFVAKDHRIGMRLAKQHKFTEAIPYFEKSIDFFIKNKWVDKYRYITLMSSSKTTYLEMGLCNIAFCYSQTNNGIKAKEYYERTLKDFPENSLAIAGLNMLNSIDNK